MGPAHVVYLVAAAVRDICAHLLLASSGPHAGSSSQPVPKSPHLDRSGCITPYDYRALVSPLLRPLISLLPSPDTVLDPVPTPRQLPLLSISLGSWPHTCPQKQRPHFWPLTPKTGFILITHTHLDENSIKFPLP